MTTKKEKLFINIVLALFVACIICCFTLYPIFCDTVSAEELTSNSVLNFNQLVTNITSNNSSATISNYTVSVTSDITSNGFVVYFNSVNLIAGHVYFVQGLPNSRLFTRSGSAVFDEVGTFIATYVRSYTSADAFFYHSSYGSSVPTGSYSLMICDLTQIFGSGNEPTTINEFKSYFTNDYYAYTTSTLISLNTLDAYTNGVNDTLSNLSYTFTAADSYNRISNANVKVNNISYDSTLNKTTLGSDFVSLGVPASTQNGVLYFPFSTTLNAGDTISLSGYYGYAVFGSGTYSVDIVVVNGDSFSIIDTSSKTGSTINDLKHIENLNYTLPFSCSGIYFISQGAGVYVSNFTISLQVFNFQSLINDAYDAGRASVDNDISIAYDNGYRNGLAESNPYTFNALFGAVFDAPIQALTGLLDFDILGVNMKGLYLSLFTLALIIFVVKLCLGKV